MTFEEVLRAWVARKLGKQLLPDDEVAIYWAEGSACDTCGYAGYTNVTWRSRTPGGKLKADAWTFRDEEMLGLTRELVVLALDLEAVSGTVQG
jgi:hypothetical protein